MLAIILRSQMNYLDELTQYLLELTGSLSCGSWACYREWMSNIKKHLVGFLGRYGGRAFGWFIPSLSGLKQVKCKMCKDVLMPTPSVFTVQTFALLSVFAKDYVHVPVLAFVYQTVIGCFPIHLSGVCLDVCFEGGAQTSSPSLGTDLRVSKVRLFGDKQNPEC